MTANPPPEPWGSCPECKAAIREGQSVCAECGFPLKPRGAAPAAAGVSTKVRRNKLRRSGRGRRRVALEGAGESPGAMIFAILGLFVPVLAIVGLCMSKKGSGAFILSWIDIGLWFLSIVVIFSRHP
jgi:hypothetical protein